MAQRTFSIEINIAESFTVEEIWPDGDAPENPTVEDVKEVFFRGRRSVHATCADWGLEIRKEDLRFTTHDPKDVEQLRELVQQLHTNVPARDPHPAGPRQVPHGGV